MRTVVVVTGTGTEIGKTHTSCALLRAAGAGAVGLKPIESGVSSDEGDDGRALRLASDSTFHVKHLAPPYLLRRPVSPHLAAADEGRTVSIEDAARYVARASASASFVLVELPGGLFSPLGQGRTNADLARWLRPDAVLLVAPDRLGVLHDVTAAVRAFHAEGGVIGALALVSPGNPDASTGTNGRELRALWPSLAVFEIPRGRPEALATSREVTALYESLRAPRDT